MKRKLWQNSDLNDSCRPKMHKTYAAYFSAVDIDFALNVRKSPISLHQIRIEVSSFLAIRLELSYKACNTIRFYSA